MHTEEAHSVPLSAFVLSQTPLQQERRKQRTQTDIQELADSIKGVGQIHPILARPLLDKLGRQQPVQELEIVAGEGRYLGAQLAGLQEIRAEIRALSDEQVEEIQLIENLQRIGLHELVEAEGYDALIKRGHSAEEIAERVGKSKRTVYTRLQLLKLDPASREAFRRGELNASTAMLIARIPVASLQRRACGEITKPRYKEGEPMTYREALWHIQDNYMLRLAEAPFDTGDGELIPKAGACGRCPKRTGNQPELFADIAGADVCTDPPCFKAKREAHAARQLKNAKTAGQKIIAGPDAKKAIAYESDDDVSLAPAYVQLTDKPHQDPKHRTYAQLLGTEVKPILLKTPQGKLVEVIDRASATKALKAAGVGTSSPGAAGKAKSAQAKSTQDRKQRAEMRFRARLFRAVFDKAPAKPSRQAIEKQLADQFHIGDFDAMSLCEALGWDDFDMDRPEKALAKLSEAHLYRLLHVIDAAEELDPYGRATKLLAAAKDLRIDAGKIRKDLEAEEKATAAAAKTAKPAKKKAARKGK